MGYNQPTEFEYFFTELGRQEYEYWVEKIKKKRE